MPVKPSYCRDLPQGIAALRGLPTEWVGRKQLQDALEISKTVAWRLIRYCGGVAGPGNALVCRRLELIGRLEELLADGGKVEFEVRRRERLGQYLERIRPEVVANRTKVVPGPEAQALMNTRLSSLPANVELKREKLTIEFFGTEDFLAAVGAVVYALNNDFEKIRDFIERDR